MMFTITPDQQYILSILHATKVMRKGQALRLLGKPGCDKPSAYALRCLDQLRHIRKISWKSGDILTTPMLYHAPADDEMLSAIDIMLDLSGSKPLSVSSGPEPYKLCFLSRQGDDLRGFAIIVVKPGEEETLAASLCGAPDGRTVIFLLSGLAQKDRVKTPLPHYFALYDNGRYRYFGRGVKSDTGPG